MFFAIKLSRASVWAFEGFLGGIVWEEGRQSARAATQGGAEVLAPTVWHRGLRPTKGGEEKVRRRSVRKKATRARVLCDTPWGACTLLFAIAAYRYLALVCQRSGGTSQHKHVPFSDPLP